MKTSKKIKSYLRSVIIPKLHNITLIEILVAGKIKDETCGAPIKNLRRIIF